MRKPHLAPLVYARLFPAPRSTDPANFDVHISRNLIPEVRAETSCYYGPANCLEAQYPGLDYTFRPHRIRLARFTYHRRLFRAFDEMRLTSEEIWDLCKWEGTRWAKEKYEAENKRRIRDTTWDGIAISPKPPASSVRTHLRGGEGTGFMMNGKKNDGRTVHNEGEEAIDHRTDGVMEEVDSEDELENSIGIDLNQHLLAATAARARGEQVVLDADWEQWLKEAAERSTSEATSFTGVGSSRGLLTSPILFGQQSSPLLQSDPPRSTEVYGEHQYVAYPATTSSAPPTGTAM